MTITDINKPIFNTIYTVYAQFGTVVHNKISDNVYGAIHCLWNLNADPAINIKSSSVFNFLLEI